MLTLSRYGPEATEGIARVNTAMKHHGVHGNIRWEHRSTVVACVVQEVRVAELPTARKLPWLLLIPGELLHIITGNRSAANGVEPR